MKTINLLIIALFICTCALAQNKKDNTKFYDTYNNCTTEYFGDLEVRVFHDFNSVTYSLKSLFDASCASYRALSPQQKAELQEAEKQKTIKENAEYEKRRSEHKGVIFVDSFSSAERKDQRRASKISLDSDQPIRDAFQKNLSKKDVKSLTDDLIMQFTVDKQGNMIDLRVKCKTDPNNLNHLDPKKIEKVLTAIAKIKFDVSKIAIDEHGTFTFIAVDALKDDGDVLLYRSRYNKEKTLEF